MTGGQPLHGTVAARWSPDEGWRGVLISGPPGAGKSDLALRLMLRLNGFEASAVEKVAAALARLYPAAGLGYSARLAARPERPETRGRELW